LVAAEVRVAGGVRHAKEGTAEGVVVSLPENNNSEWVRCRIRTPIMAVEAWFRARQRWVERGPGCRIAANRKLFCHNIFVCSSLTEDCQDHR
jgi:hypothetical protein